MAVVLNDLFDYGLKIYQDTNGFKFSLDSLLLSEFVEIKKNDKNILDLCCGNAPLPLIIAKNHDVQITGVELQKEVVSLAEKSVKHNKLENKITIINDNAKNMVNSLKKNSFDIITCNPPFFKYENNNLTNIDEKKALARHEITITLKELLEIASILLKDNGTFYMVHRPERLEEILVAANKLGFHAKRIEFIFSKSDDYAIMVLLKFKKNSNIGIKIGEKIIDRNTKTYQNIFKRS